MSDAKTKGDWARTASIMAVIAEVNRDKKKRPAPFTANDFNPTVERKKPKVVQHKDLSVLRDIFVR